MDKNFIALVKGVSASGKSTRVFNFLSYFRDFEGLTVVDFLHNGEKVVFSQDSCYVEYRNGMKDKLVQQEGLHIFKLWVLKNQAMPFPGQA